MTPTVALARREPRTSSTGGSRDCRGTSTHDRSLHGREVREGIRRSRLSVGHSSTPGLSARSRVWMRHTRLLARSAAPRPHERRRSHWQSVGLSSFRRVRWRRCPALRDRVSGRAASTQTSSARYKVEEGAQPKSCTLACSTAPLGAITTSRQYRQSLERSLWWKAYETPGDTDNRYRHTYSG